MSTRIISYNVNGIRSAISKGLLDWLAAENFDIICFQETKAQLDQIDVAAFEALGYQVCGHSAEKKGYSGVATLAKRKPDLMIEGCGLIKYDSEGRILRTDFDDWTLLNCYFPSGTTGDIRQVFKMEFLADFYDWVQTLKKERPNLIVVGDYNIAHQEMDIHNPKGNQKSSGFLPEERAWMTQWFTGGFTDAFRHLNPDKAEYSWWSFRAGARGNNKGWRIDYQSVTDNLKDKLIESYHFTNAAHSDHCPVYLEIDI
jgi:exodeoxyribonuclease-3